jgi:hypothetical protein
MQINKIISVFLLLLAFTVTDVLAQNNDTIAFGPYLQNMTYRSVTICWSTLDGESIVTSPEGKTQTFRQYKQHYITVPRLNEKTTHKFDVLGNGSAEGMGSFTTFPRGIEPFRFVALGDTRSRHDIHQKIVDQVIDQKPLFVINTGDLVSSGKSIHDWEQFFRINRELMRSIPYYPVLGNHEKDSEYYFDFFNLPGDERNYHFSVGDALFIMLDSEGPDVQMPGYVKDENKDAYWTNYNLKYYKQQKAWLEHILTLHEDAGYIFIVQHSPLYSIKKSRVADTKLRRKFWGDIFERHRVQVFMNGHDHHYHHAIDGGTHFITTAGGGAGLYETDSPQPETVKFSKIEHFITVDVGLNEAKLTAIDINGEIIEEIIISKRN